MHSTQARPIFLNLLMIFLTLRAVGPSMAHAAKTVGNQWKRTIQKFEASDKKVPPPKNGILFTGSSSIRMWKLDRSFRDLPVINRGFGGSTYADLNQFFDRLVVPHAPKAIVLYSGDNDIARGDSVEQIMAEFKNFVARVHKTLPDAKVFVFPIKPSVSRWALWDKMRNVNQRIATLAESDPRLTYVDGATPLLDRNGQPRADLLLKDGLHMNAHGYRIWTDLLRPYLDEMANKERRR